MTAPQLVITLQPNGHIQVQGPLDNKLACYGMLEMAKEAISAHHRKVAEGPQIVAATPDMVPARN